MANNPHLAMATLSSPSASGSATVAGELSDVSSPPGHSGRLSEEEDGSSSQASGSGGGRPDPVRRPLHVTPEELRAKFQDFDDRAVYERVVGHALGEHALNFVVEFGNNTARVACDLTEADFELLLAEPEHARDPDTPIRWMYFSLLSLFLFSSLVFSMPDTDCMSETFGIRVSSAASSRPSAAATTSPGA